MKKFVAATLIGMASVAAFAQVQVTAPQVQVTTPKTQVTTMQPQTPAHDAGNSEMAPAEHKHHRHHHHHKKAMEMDTQK